MPLLHEILGNMCIAIACFASFDVINFQINLTFLIKPFFNMTKMSRPKLNILRIKRAFKVKWKAFFIMSKRFSFAICAFNKNISEAAAVLGYLTKKSGSSFRCLFSAHFFYENFQYLILFFLQWLTGKKEDEKKIQKSKYKFFILSNQAVFSS